MQTSSETINSILLENRFKLSFASYLSESNFIQEAVVSFYSKFLQQKFVEYGNGGSDFLSAWRAKYFSRALVIRFQLKPLTSLQLRSAPSF